MIRGLQKLLTDSEPIKWGVQNCLGLTVCLVFALVPAVSFTGSCATALFYAVAASCFSIDRSFGGRVRPQCSVPYPLTIGHLGTLAHAIADAIARSPCRYLAGCYGSAFSYPEVSLDSVWLRWLGWREALACPTKA